VSYNSTVATALSFVDANVMVQLLLLQLIKIKAEQNKSIGEDSL